MLVVGWADLLCLCVAVVLHLLVLCTIILSSTALSLTNSMESITQTLLETDWRITALSLICGAQLYSTIKKTFTVPWTNPENVITKGTSASLVTLYVFKGSGVTVSSSCFSSKIETYCRLAGNNRHYNFSAIIIVTLYCHSCS